MLYPLSYEGGDGVCAGQRLVVARGCPGSWPSCPRRAQSLGEREFSELLYRNGRTGSKHCERGYALPRSESGSPHAVPMRVADAKRDTANRNSGSHPTRGREARPLVTRTSKMRARPTR